MNFPDDDAADAIGYAQWLRYLAFGAIIWAGAVLGGIGLIWAMFQ